MATDTRDGPPLQYYPAVLARRVSHYAERRLQGYTDRGSLETAAEEILRASARRGFHAGSHFPGLWPRDLCFSTPGLCALGFDDAVRSATVELLDSVDTTFYTDFGHRFDVATPTEGVDTFPALVVLLDEVDALESHADTVASMASLHREKFFGEDERIVSGPGSSWWDSAAHPREGYNTAMLLTAVERLERRAIETTYTGLSEDVRDGFLTQLWNGSYFDERRGSSVLACDANVIPLYFGLVDDERANRIVDALGRLETKRGVKMRARPFTLQEVRPEFLLHQDYHYHIWPWNSLAYAIGLAQYGYHERAQEEVARVERLLERYGNFLEVLTLDGEPYVKRGYASAQDFTVAAALWVEFHRQHLLDPTGR